MTPISTFSARLREGIRKKGLRNYELSDKTGIHRGTLTHYLSGDYEAKQENIEKLAKALNVEMAWLMGYDVPMDKFDDTNKIDFKLLDEILSRGEETPYKFLYGDKEIDKQTLMKIFKMIRALLE